MSWRNGISWTEGYTAETENPDGTKEIIKVHTGPFFYTPHLMRIAGYRLEIYAGFRPTPTWSAGYGNEGDFGTGFIGRLMKKIGWGNMGFALRMKKS